MRSLFKLLTGLVGLFTLGVAQATLPIQTITTSQGVRVYLVQSQNLPMVDVQIDFDAGSRRDPAGQAGLASSVAGTSRQACPGSLKAPLRLARGTSRVW